MAIQIQSFNQILGAMIRTIIANTPLNDVNTGSVLLTLLEACAANDFENNAAILNVLELLNIDAISNNDLDDRAADYGLTRYPAIPASGAVSFYNINITKQSTALYVLKPAPISGQTVLYVNNTTGWANSGSVYIGRGTSQFEGPIPYTSITVYPTYSQVNLGSALNNNHLISETVINSQGQPDQLIAAGTVVMIPANNQNPQILYTTLLDAVIPSGETEVDNVQVIAQVAGSQGNAPINTITQFQTLPFAGATVGNTSPLSGGTDIETDTQLRNRLKAYSSTLSRGTSAAILAAVIGVSDSTDNNQVISAVISEPVAIGSPSILYIDNGSSGGFQPTEQGQSVDTLLTNATGTEEFLQLANFPVPRAQVVNTATAPYALTNGMSLTVSIDGNAETVFFDTSQFVNISAATIQEVVVAINDGATTFSARLTNNSTNILIYPTDFSAETIQVAPLTVNDSPLLYANSILEFPTNQYSYISLYQNSTKLTEKAKSATLETVPYAQWNITVPGDLIIGVDNTPPQDRAFSLSDFPGASSFGSLTLNQWATALNSQFAGLTASVTSNQTLQLVSNQVGADSALAITGGTYLSQLFGDNALTSVGQTSQFLLNRQTGNLQILTTINPGDNITAGSTDTRGFVVSASTSSGLYNLSADSFGRPAEAVIVPDSTVCMQRSVNLPIGTVITVSDQGNSVMRILSSSASTFESLLPQDFVYLTYRTSNWLDSNNAGLFRVVDKGSHTNPGVDTFIDVWNANITGQTINVQDSTDIQAFTTDGYPQVWRGVYLPNPPSSSLSDVVTSLTTDLINVNAAIYQSDSVRITSTTQNGGSIAIPVAVGNCALLFTETVNAQFGNPALIANAVSNKPLAGEFRTTTPISTNVWLDRYTYTDLKGTIEAAATPDVPPYSGAYSETIQSTAFDPSQISFADIVNFTDGDNRGQFRSIAAEIATDQVGTQEGTARTAFDHVAGDGVQIVKSLNLSADDTIVFVMDENPSANTISINAGRTGLVNSGSESASFIPTTTEFSANDYDNSTGIDFGNLVVWGTSTNGTNFADYAVQMRARNWYASGGTTSGLGQMIVRSAEYGPNGNDLRFSINYPNAANLSATTTYTNEPSYTLFQYYFGSGAAKSTAIVNNAQISVKGPYPDTATNFPSGTVSTGNYYDYTFNSGNLSSVVVGDVLSINTTAGVSSFNSGQFSVQNISGTTVRVYNPNAANTSPGAPQVFTIDTVADIVGTPTAYNITTVADVSGNLSGKYFIIYSTAGSTAVWYDVGNVGTPQPSAGTGAYIKVSTVVQNDSAATIASKTAATLQSYLAWTSSAASDVITITNAQNGALSSGDAGTSGFTVSTTAGTNNNSVDGKYFLIYDTNGSVSIWYNVSGNTSEPADGALRSIEVTGVTYGMTAAQVATATAAAITGDSMFTASAASNALTITTTFNGVTPNAQAGTSGFAVSSTPGSLMTPETIANAAGLVFFSLTGTAVSAITNTINQSSVMMAAPVGDASLTISKSTSEDKYIYSGNATALGYGHNPNDPILDAYIGMVDGINWIKSFQNANPNFTLKAPLILNAFSGTSPYQMNTCPNSDVSDIGELFKLTPTTVKNVYHHLTQKAISQLPIVANISIADDRKNIQITSLQLGSAGAVEVVGGSMNSAQAYLLTESEITSDTSGNQLLVKVSAYPDTFNVDDTITITNDTGVARLSRLGADDTINVIIPSNGSSQYEYNPKVINVTSGTTFTITDVSSIYGLATGAVWRWTSGGGTSFAQVNAGDQLFAYGTFTGWDQGNLARTPGDGYVAGLPIIAVNNSLNYIDAVNPYGFAMSSTAVGTGTVQICPTPIIKWNLAHTARIFITAMSSDGATVSVTCSTPHLLHNGSSIVLRDDGYIPDETYGPVTVTSSNQFTFAYSSAAFSEGSVNASFLSSIGTQTRYKIETLGFNNNVRISHYDGDSPRFTDCGVAVDDYVIIGGTTFNSSNNGTFRVLGVDNDSLLIQNVNAITQVNTIRQFNFTESLTTWTANSNIVTGSAGAFKNVTVGVWVKKEEDPDTYYAQVTGLNNANPALATQITLGINYIGTSDNAYGAIYDELNDVGKGVLLQGQDDIVVLEGDVVQVNDTLYVQDIINTDWFTPANIGSFGITQYGTNPITYKPFLRVTNASGVAQTNAAMSVNTGGFYIIEALANKFSSLRTITHVNLDDINSTRRSIYMVPASRSYKFSNANSTSISSTSKLGYSTGVTTGIDGYLYYTGLLQKVQYIVDGFEPDTVDYPGFRAVGSAIETLPPLINNITISLNIITNNGVNVGDVSNSIKSVIIDYVDGLGVGQNVILSEIIAQVMTINGVAAVTFTTPDPSTEYIAIASNERATIAPANISIASS